MSGFDQRRIDPPLIRSRFSADRDGLALLFSLVDAFGRHLSKNLRKGWKEPLR